MPNSGSLARCWLDDHWGLGCSFDHHAVGDEEIPGIYIDLESRLGINVPDMDKEHDAFRGAVNGWFQLAFLDLECASV